MTSLSRNLAVAFLLGVMIGSLVGCGQREPSRRPKALEDIASTVPKITGLPLKQAQVVLSLVALKVGNVALEKTNDPSLHTQVFEQDPPPGTAVRGATAVDVKVYRYVPTEEGASEGEE